LQVQNKKKHNSGQLKDRANKGIPHRLGVHVAVRGEKNRCEEGDVMYQESNVSRTIEKRRAEKQTEIYRKEKEGGGGQEERSGGQMTFGEKSRM